MEMIFCCRLINNRLDYSTRPIMMQLLSRRAVGRVEMSRGEELSFDISMYSCDFPQLSFLLAINHLPLPTTSKDQSPSNSDFFLEDRSHYVTLSRHLSIQNVSLGEQLFHV